MKSAHAIGVVTIARGGGFRTRGVMKEANAHTDAVRGRALRKRWAARARRHFSSLTSLPQPTAAERSCHRAAN